MIGMAWPVGDNINMAKTGTSENDGDGQYRISAVCRLTGLSTHVLRAWEKRHSVVKPTRSANRVRLYSESDLHKLYLLKSLVDSGQAIGTLVNLKTDELERRVRQTHATGQLHLAESPLRIATIGESLRITVTSWDADAAFQLIGVYTDTADLLADEERGRLDAVVLEQPTLHPDSGIAANKLLGRLSAEHLVIVYDYASRSALRRLQSSRVTALRTPLQLTVLHAHLGRVFARSFCDDRVVESLRRPAAARRYTDRELAYIAEQSATVACECPQHLSSLIASLTRFENYSAECESRNAEDAEFHGYLFATASQARCLLEQALKRVIEMKGLRTQPVDS